MTRATFVVVKRGDRLLYKHCRVCDRKRQRELRAIRRNDPKAVERERGRRREARARNVEHYREYHRNYQAAWRAKLKAEDPAHYFEVHVLPHRFRATKVRWIAGRDTYVPPDAIGELVDGAPLRDFARLAYPRLDTSTLAQLFRMDMHTARRVFEEERRVALHVVDRALTVGLGRPDLLNVLYPFDAPPEPKPAPQPTPDLIGAYRDHKRARRTMGEGEVAA